MGRRNRQRAVVSDRRASFWFYSRDALYLHHPDGREETCVPVPHLIDDALMFEHYARLAGKNWVSRGAIEELREIAAGARR